MNFSEQGQTFAGIGTPGLKTLRQCIAISAHKERLVISKCFVTVLPRKLVKAKLNAAEAQNCSELLFNGELKCE